MERRSRFFELHEKLNEAKIGVVMVQIEEAHSKLWPIGRDHCPINHTSFEDRAQRANDFIETYNCPYPVYVDGFDNQFEKIFRSWPDKYYFIGQDKVVLNKSEYGREGDRDGKIVLDYVNLLKRYL